MVAQNDTRNLASAAGSAGGAVVVMQRDLLGRVFMATPATAGPGQILHQNKIISDFPTNLGGQIDRGFLRSYESEKPLTGDRFGGMSKYLTTYSKILLPLNLDTLEMDLKSATWFQFKGVDALKPSSSLGITYDTNSSNQTTKEASESITQISGLNMIFNYGERAGSSTTANLLYQPLYLLNLTGPGVNEVEQQITFQVGREFHRNALALNSRTTITAAPLRELPGRTKTILNTTNLRGVYDISPLSLINYEALHSVTKRSETGNNNLQSITEDAFRLNYEYAFRPKVLAISSLGVTAIQIGDQKTLSDAYSIGLSYTASERVTMTLNGGYQFRHAPDQATQMAQLYRFTFLYLVGPKTVIETKLSKEIRPSFADEGIFVNEDTISFEVTQSIALRWRAKFLADYILREDDNPASFFGLKQNDIGGQLSLSYFISENDTVIFSFSSFMLEDLRSKKISRRSSAAVSWNHAF